MSKPLPIQILSPTTTASAVLQELPGQTVSYADIYVEGADIRWTVDPAEYGTLSSSVGTRLGDGKCLRLMGGIKNFKCIAVSGTPTVRVQMWA